MKNVLFQCFSRAKHFYPTKGRGMTGAEHGCARGGYQHRDAAQLMHWPKASHVRPHSDATSPPLTPRHSTHLSCYLRCFIYKPPTANSTHLRARIPPDFHLGKNLATVSSTEAANQGKKTASHPWMQIPLRGSVAPSPLPHTLLTPQHAAAWETSSHSCQQEIFSTSTSGN